MIRIKFTPDFKDILPLSDEVVAAQPMTAQYILPWRIQKDPPGGTTFIIAKSTPRPMTDPKGSIFYYDTHSAIEKLNVTY
jgi:hypothetical protein